MADLEVLKKRAENAERHLKAVQSSRESECEALSDLWTQIRNRFTQQDQEIAEYRARVSDLTDANAELTQLVDVMIRTIEKSVVRTKDETVPRITELARVLLAAEPIAPLGDGTAKSSNAETRSPNANKSQPQRSEINLKNQSKDKSIERNDLGEDATRGSKDGVESLVTRREPRAVSDRANSVSASPGIRNLVARIEAAVARPGHGTPSNGADLPESPEAADDGEDTALARELKEIESLRSELNGLRERISAGGQA